MATSTFSTNEKSSDLLGEDSTSKNLLPAPLSYSLSRINSCNTNSTSHDWMQDWKIPEEEIRFCRKVSMLKM
jgi:hypothetical protein